MIHIQCLNEERPAVGKFLDDLASWFSHAVTCLGFNSYQHGCRASLSCLKGGRKFKAVARKHPVVMITGGNRG
jgi:hypothetical protein